MNKNNQDREEMALANRARFPQSFAVLAEFREAFGPECAAAWVVEGEEFTGPVPFDQMPSFIGPRQPVQAVAVANELAFFQVVSARCDAEIRAANIAARNKIRVHK